jgi:DtxR family Mn-dependent transcriptional regulator
MAAEGEQAVSIHVERYLEAAYRLSDRDDFIAVSELARFLHVAPASVSEMVKKLAEQGWVEHKPYRGVKLTAGGRHIGGEAVRRHRLAERLLTDLLGASAEQAHEEAHRLEGFLRGEIEDRVMRVLGYPLTCPHGNPMDVGSVENAIPLSEIKETRPFRIAKIRYDTPEFLNYLKSLDLIPNSQVAVTARAPFDGPITLRVNESQEHQVGAMVLHNIWVDPPL